MNPGYAFLLARVIGMGLERPLVKRLGVERDSVASVVLYVGAGELMFLAVLAWQYMQDPALAANLQSWLPLAIIPGLLNAACFYSFIAAMRVGEVSLLTPLFASCFVLMYAIDVVAGFAALALLPLAGVLLVTLGVAFLSPAQAEAGRRISVWQRYDPRWLLAQPGAVLMLVNATAFALVRFFDKSMAPEAHPVLYALIVNLPTVLIGLVLLAVGSLRGRASSMAALRALARERWRILLWLTIFGQGAFLMLLYSLDYFPPSVIEPVTQLGVFIAIALGGLWFGEQTSARWLPAAMVVAGAGLLLV
ncbi:EamA family transporter [bacterium]|nr:EamA family transporter [bacterium]